MLLLKELFLLVEQYLILVLPIKRNHLVNPVVVVLMVLPMPMEQHLQMVRGEPNKVEWHLWGKWVRNSSYIYEAENTRR